MKMNEAKIQGKVISIINFSFLCTNHGSITTKIWTFFRVTTPTHKMYSILNEAKIQGKVVSINKISFHEISIYANVDNNMDFFRGSTPSHKMHSLLNEAKIQGIHRKIEKTSPGQQLIALGFRKKWTFFSLSNFE
jgi:hypothetical protein